MNDKVKVLLMHCELALSAKRFEHAEAVKEWDVMGGEFNPHVARLKRELNKLVKLRDSLKEFSR